MQLIPKLMQFYRIFKDNYLLFICLTNCDIYFGVYFRPNIIPIILIEILIIIKL